MDLDLYCDGKHLFSCSRDNWDKIRCDIIDATIEYLSIYFGIELFEENTTEYYYQTILINTHNLMNNQFLTYEYINEIHSNSNKINLFKTFFKNKNYINGLTLFNLIGLYLLCEKMDDNDGFLSSGNALDIMQFLTSIKPFLLKNNYLDLETYQTLETLFKTAIERKTFIEIR